MGRQKGRGLEANSVLAEDSSLFLPSFLQFAIGSLMDDYLGECLIMLVRAVL